MSFFNLRFSKKDLPEFDFSSLKVDMHSHLIPGIDDGSNSMEETLAMLRKFKEMGFSKVITTPHIKLGSFENTSEIIQQGAHEVKQAILENNLDIHFEAAAEYYFDFSLMEKIEKNDILSFSDGHVLVEYSFHQRPMGYKEMIFALQMKGYKPILAHFERYPYYHNSVEKAEQLRDRGVKIQLNLLSLFGHYGPAIQKQAELLIKEKQVDLVASDCHRLDHLEIIQANAKNPHLHKLMEMDIFNNSL